MTREEILGQIRAVLAGDGTRDEKLQAVCDLLLGEVPHYDWVGFYLVEPGERMLALGPFAGAPTEHVRIPFGRGICGQAAEREETFVVQDVEEQDNYLSCSPHVRSEIVLPLFAGGRIAGELDIDSHRLAPFDDADRGFLDAVCRLVEPSLHR